MVAKTPSGIVPPPSSKPSGKAPDPGFIRPAGGHTPLGEVGEKPAHARPPGPGHGNPPKSEPPPKK